MKNPLNLLLSLLLGLTLLPATALQAQETSGPTSTAPPTLAPQITASELNDGEDEDEIEWMLDGLFLTADTIGMEEADLFSALAHGLSMADVARAHGLNPIEILDIALSFEESDILAELLEEEINLEDAEDWRDEAAESSAWLIYSEDPFGLEDIVWVLDGAADACDLSMMELAEWMSDGSSIEDIAKEMEVKLDDVTAYSMEYLEESIEVLLLLEEIDQEEADEWLEWSEEILEELLTDENLFETLAEETWADEIVETLAELMALDSEELWDMLAEGEDLQDLLDSHKVKIEDEDLAEEIKNFLSWWNDDIHGWNTHEDF
ncbi:MAG: hypothetical protein O3A95_09185 [Planctomycetota bacterium]|nr:hypothetical protein [Planctomycetota bacterium]